MAAWPFFGTFPSYTKPDRFKSVPLVSGFAGQEAVGDLCRRIAHPHPRRLPDRLEGAQLGRSRRRRTQRRRRVDPPPSSQQMSRNPDISQACSHYLYLTIASGGAQLTPSSCSFYEQASLSVLLGPSHRTSPGLCKFKGHFPPF